MGNHDEFVLFLGFHVEISWGKEGPGIQSGGWVPGHSGAPLRPGGENLGHPSMEDVRGAKHSPPGHIGISCIICHENHKSSEII